MCVLCHMAGDTPVSEYQLTRTLQGIATTPPQSTSGVILMQNDASSPTQYQFDFSHDANAMIDAQYYNLPGDQFDYSWGF